MNILISGATGFIGSSLIEKLLHANHRIYAITRTENPKLHSNVKQIRLNAIASLDQEFDAFINLAGENIASKPWTKKRKKELYDSRIHLTNQVRASLKYPPKLVVSMSAVGFYGVAKNEIFDEYTSPKQGFSHELCRDWEDSANAFFNEDTRVVIFRLGVVLGVGGALDKMRTPFLCGLGGPIADGRQWFSWVHINDVNKGITNAIEDESFIGTYNLVAPQQVEQKAFAKYYASTLKRPAWVTIPKFVFDLIFGEMACLLTHGARIVPERLSKQGFEFEFTKINEALHDIERQYQLR
ncbi:hypothetical protein MUS1_09320 [Marinomonas ushuaiensis DSM 15871]|uniref:TIGR01777 family protein n=1 Tax=Marinomonas ushuaiensis DSM 15871 TaxID=1122207 RepID=X7E6K7_9GAMM|nr:TIGR01777 family oxidoreductase [Marinomonas ushuaiensis]ETX11475.1 hypothetical protein MUS1_09320 [Marinomonas ushuaiensis DSM 15871]